MKKYLQITIVLAVFFAAVFVRHFTRNSGQPQVLAQSGSDSGNTNALPPLPTESPAQAGSQPSASQSAVASSSGVPVVTPTASSQSQPQRSGAPGTPVPTATPRSAPTPQTAGQYKDGTYTGAVANAYYGYMQVRVTVSGGKITDVTFLQHPHHAFTSVRINTIAMPMLKQEAIQAQSYRVNIISGASASSIGFIESLRSALQQATP